MGDEEYEKELNEAFAALELAIDRVRHAQGDGGVLVDWVVIMTSTDPLECGHDYVSTSWTGSENLPTYRMLGLLDYAATGVRAEIASAVQRED